MSHSKVKSLQYALLVFGVIIATYSLYSTRIETKNPLASSQSSQQTSLTAIDSAEDNRNRAQEKIIHQRLYEDFENAFFKQYTPPLNCENLEYSSQSPDCTNHLIEAKEAFKQEYIKTRGLPKDAFGPHQLSYRN